MRDYIGQRLAEVQTRVLQAEQMAQRPLHSVAILAVSKGQPYTAIQAAAQAGQRAFGENYLQEALAKINALRGQNLEWHYIGKIQRRKIRQIAHNFDWVQTIENESTAQALSHERSPQRSDLNVCIQVNISREIQKSGVLPEDVHSLATAIAKLPRLKLRGLMAIPAIDASEATYQELWDLYRSLKQTNDTLDVLSVGMSQDLETAITYGATLVRVGAAIFGERVVR